MNKTCTFLTLFCCCAAALAEDAAPPAFTPEKVEIKSTFDGTLQPIDIFDFRAADDLETPRPLLTLMHTWSSTRNNFAHREDWLREAQTRQWLVVVPEYRGPNKNPEAGGSKASRQDVLDAVAYMTANYPVDESRIYLAGTSGGGHMAMVMAAEKPGLWAGVSAWAGISDLAAWHAETEAAGHRYWQDVEAVAGGAPGSAAAVDKALHYRSPVHHLAAAADVPIDLSTGIHDGHKGSVPISHTLRAFNAIAEARGDEPVSAETMAALASREPGPADEEQDESYGRRIHLRRYAGPSRVTIFEGGHEGLAAPAMQWLEQQVKKEKE